MSSTNVRLGAAPPPSFNSAQGVFGEIQGELGTLSGLWSTLSSLMADLQREQNAKPGATDTTGMKPEQAAAAQKKDQEALTTWENNCKTIQGRIQDCRARIEQSQQKIANLQGIKLPAAQSKDRNDMDRWMDDQRKAQEAMMNGASAGGFERRVGGGDNVDTIKAELAAIQLKINTLQTQINLSRMVNANARTEQQQTLGRTPPRNDGLTIG